jgi:hypothetical protein
MPVQKKGSWIGEGDDGTYMNMLGNGLRAYEAGSYGGWGGRQISEHRSDVMSLPTDTSQQAMASSLSSISEQSNKNGHAYPDFFPAVQNDFAARLKWSVTPRYTDANHAPVIRIEGPLNILASPGETIKLTGTIKDPDGNKVSVSWWPFEVGTYPGKISISNANTEQVKIIIPKDAISGQTNHVILEVTDDGSPPITAYRRVIITVK